MRDSQFVFQRLELYLLVMAVFWFLGLILIIMWGYQDTFLTLNRIHTPFWDAIMPHYTHLGGGGIVTAILSLVFLRMRDLPLTLTLAPAMLAVMLLVAISKQLLFPEWFRPPAIFEPQLDYHHVSLTSERSLSFPSGHSTAAATMFSFLAFFVCRYGRAWGILIALFTISVAYSRVYIGVHYFGDVLAGTILGTAIGLITIWMLYRRMRRWVESMEPDAYVRATRLVYLVASLVVLVSLFTTYIPLYV